MDNLSAVISFPRFIRDLAMPRASRAAAGGFCYLALNRGRERIETRMNGITTCTSQNVPPGFIAGSSGDTIPVRREPCQVLVFSGCNSHPATGSLQPVAIGAAVEPIVPPSAAPSRPVNSGLRDLVLIATFLYSAVWCRVSVAVFPLVLLARGGAWPERLRPCHWRLAMPGFPGVVLIPLGRLQTSPIPLLARGALLFQHPHPRTGEIHGRPKRRAQEANHVQDASQAQDASQTPEVT